MGLFGRNFDKPGPGVSKDEPRKTGAARFFELLMREFWDLTKINLLFCLIIFPSMMVFLLGLTGFFGGFSGIALILSILLAFPVGGALTAYVYYITKMMRDDPSYVWYEFKRKFIENFKQAAPIGMLCAAFVYAQIMLWVIVVFGETGADIIWPILALLSLALFGMITPYIFLHLAYIDLKTSGVIKNSIFMSFGYMPRSFMGSLLGGIMWIAFAVFFEASLLAVPLIIMIGISISVLMCMMWVWKPFNEYFKIEEQLIARLDEEDSE